MYIEKNEFSIITVENEIKVFGLSHKKTGIGAFDLWGKKEEIMGNANHEKIPQTNYGIWTPPHPGGDYIVGTEDGGVWIIETKGGFNRYGQSEDIDAYTAKKFSYLKNYIDKYKKLGGIVRQDKQTQRLCICTDNYSDDIHSDSWSLLNDIF